MSPRKALDGMRRHTRFLALVFSLAVFVTRQSPHPGQYVAMRWPLSTETGKRRKGLLVPVGLPLRHFGCKQRGTEEKPKEYRRPDSRLNLFGKRPNGNAKPLRVDAKANTQKKNLPN